MDNRARIVPGNARAGGGSGGRMSPYPGRNTIIFTDPTANPGTPRQLRRTPMKIHATLLAFALALAAPVAPVLAEDAPNYIEEMKRWQPKAEAGDAEAQFQLGQMYALGHGFKQNFKTAAEWYEKAAQQSHAKARTALGLLYSFGVISSEKDNETDWLEKAAAQDEPVAQVFLGDLAKGQDKYDEARKWYEQAAANGSADAMIAIAKLHEYGEDTSKDLEQARQWNEKASKQKKISAAAMGEVGLYYATAGGGFAKNIGKSREWYEKACNAGHSRSCFYIAQDYRKGENGYNKDAEKALTYLEKSSNLGSAQASSELSEEYVKEGSSLGVSLDAKKSFSYMEKAATQGDRDAMEMLIQIHSHGAQNVPGMGDIPVDLAKAAKWQEAKKNGIDEVTLEFLVQTLRELQN